MDHMDEQRRWELRPAMGRVARAVYATIAAAVWLPVEALLLRWTVAQVATPFDVGPWVDGFSSDWSAVPVATGFVLVTIAWTAGGYGVAAAIFRARRGDVVAAGPAGIRVERVTRDGHRVVADLAWRDIHEARVPFGSLTVEVVGTGGATRLSPAGSPDQHRQIERFVNEHVAALPDRPPVLAGMTAYLDDRGATLVENRAHRRYGAVAGGAAAVLFGVNAAAFAADGVWPAAVMLVIPAVGLVVATATLLCWTPRWIARPGAVVLERRLGAGFAFQARRLELVRLEGEQVTHQLVAVADAGRRRRRTILWAATEPGPLESAGRWLARHAEVPFETRAEPP
jgi:hypothetical protein